MSAIVCGKRSIFEDLSATPQISKRIRFSSSSPVRSSPPKSSPVSASAFASNPFDYLSVLFPEMDPQLLERALEECGDDLDSAIRSLNELRLGSAGHYLGSATQNLGSAAGTSEVASDANGQVQPQVTANGEVPVGEESLPKDGADWVDLFVREMMSASDMDDAKARASRVLEVLEKSIYTRASADAAQNFHQENIMLKEQVETLIQENTVLKRAVAIQHERQKELDDRNQELQQLKQVVSQYQEQLRTLEVNNYALTLHLKQAQQSNSIPGRFHPDIF